MCVMRIRYARKSDLPAIYCMVDEWREELKTSKADWFDHKNFRRMVEQSPKTCWVAEVDGKLVGFRFVWDDTDGRAWGWTIYIEKPWRGQGLGTELFMRTAKLLKKQGFRKMYAETYLTDRLAIKWHRKVGYKRIGTFPDWYGPDEHAAVFCYDL